LFPIRAKVDNINDTSYSKLEGEERIYNVNIVTDAKMHIDSGKEITSEELANCAELTPEQISTEVDAIVNSLFTDKVVKLKIGALVMCTANIDVERGICNGSQGVIVGYAETNLQEDIVPVVRFLNGVTMKVMPHPRQSEEYPCIVVSQIPLCLAWALTIHKIQGATLDMAEMDIGRSIFADGQSYVALSRVKTLDGLYLSEFNPTKIRANPIVTAFYSEFPQCNEDAMCAETMDILSKTRNPVTATQTKIKPITSKQRLFSSSFVLPDGVTLNPFQSFENTATTLSSDIPKDSTVKTIKLSRY
jgi:ATP-dependent DNA helicase PIF1